MGGCGVGVGVGVGVGMGGVWPTLASFNAHTQNILTCARVHTHTHTYTHTHTQC